MQGPHTAQFPRFPSKFYLRDGRCVIPAKSGGLAKRMAVQCRQLNITVPIETRLILVLKAFQGGSSAQRLVLGLAFVAVLFHAAGGCCCHHAHAAFFTSQLSTPDSRQSTLDAGHCCHGHADTGIFEGNHCDDGGQDGHRHGDGCNEEPCVFVVPQQNDTVVYKLVLSHTATIAHTDTASGQSFLANRTSDSPPALFSPPLRLHLLNQIMLL